MKRPEDMPYTVYKELRKSVNANVKFYLLGARIWDSGPSWKSFLGLPSKLDQNGDVIPWPRGRTYEKSKHGPIGRKEDL